MAPSQPIPSHPPPSRPAPVHHIPARPDIQARLPHKAASSRSGSITIGLGAPIRRRSCDVTRCVGRSIRRARAAKVHGHKRHVWPHLIKLPFALRRAKYRHWYLLRKRVRHHSRADYQRGPDLRFITPSSGFQRRKTHDTLSHSVRSHSVASHSAARPRVPLKSRGRRIHGGVTLVRAPLVKLPVLSRCRT